MASRQAEISRSLGVVPAFAGTEAVDLEIERRKRFIQQCLRDSGTTGLVLGISGGVDSLAAGRLAQLAVEELRASSHDPRYRFMAVRLPHRQQQDEADAAAAMKFVAADQELTVDIEPSVTAMCGQVGLLDELTAPARDVVVGNIKARTRMVAQYAIANACNGLVIGTDHAAEAVMGFFTKFGDGACDLAPLSGLVKSQVRAIAARLGAPEHLVEKVPTADLEELEPGKPDESAYGVTYDQIDRFLLGGRVSTEAEATILGWYDRTEHKRRLPLAP